MATVLHYVEHWLELSAGFVHAQVSNSRYRGVVVSVNAVENRETFPHRPTLCLAPARRRVPDRRWPLVASTAVAGLAGLHRCRLVHVHFGYVAGDLLPLARRSRLPVVLSLHGDDITALPGRQPGHYEQLAHETDAVLVPSRFLAERAAAVGFPPERIHVAPSGVDLRAFPPTAPVDGAPTVVFVGRLVEKKGLDVLLDAWPDVTAKVRDARLQVLGNGPLASLLPHDDPSVRHVRPDPARRTAQVREALSAATVVATPSRTAANGDAESLLLVNLEAQAIGRPVVTTRHGGIPEFVVDGGTALLVPEADPAALARALVRVLTDPDLARRLGAAGPTQAARYDVRACAARVDDLYDTLVARRR